MILFKNLAFFSIIAIIFSQPQRELSEKTIELYPYITNVFVGPIEWYEEQSSGRYFRVIVTTFEIYKHIYIESIVTDEEGYKRNVELRYKVPNKLFQKGNSLRKVAFIEWSSYSNIKVEVDGKCFIMHLNLDKAKFKITSCE